MKCDLWQYIVETLPLIIYTFKIIWQRMSEIWPKTSYVSETKALGADIPGLLVNLCQINEPVAP